MPVISRSILLKGVLANRKYFKIFLFSPQTTKKFTLHLKTSDAKFEIDRGQLQMVPESRQILKIQFVVEKKTFNSS